MLHFCTKEDIKQVLVAAARYEDSFDNARAGVTEDFNRFMRRTLDYETSIVEQVDTPNIDKSYNLWLRKKHIDKASFVVEYSRTNEFTGEGTVLSDEVYELDAEKGKLTLNGRFYATVRGLRVKYNGGFKAIPGTDIMAAPANLRTAAIDQCVYNLRRTLGLNQGQSADSDKKGQIKQKPMIDGLLYEVAQTLAPYRKLFGR